MSDKQEILQNAIGPMLRRLTHPPCVDSSGENSEPNTGTCPAGKAPEFPPVEDLHLGVITSSLGGHGSATCNRGLANPDSPTGFWDYDDRGHLLPTVRAGLTLGENFLSWNGGSTTEATQLARLFETLVMGAGEHGCGFEAPLEAWYRFLVDPSPAPPDPPGGAPPLASSASPM